MRATKMHYGFIDGCYTPCGRSAHELSIRVTNIPKIVTCKVCIKAGRL